MTIFFADNAFIVIFVRFKAIAAADRPTPLERDSTRPNDTNSGRDKEPVRSGYEHGDKAATTCMRTALHTPKRLLTVVLLLLAAAVEAQTLTVGTYNMRNDNAGDARNGNGWQRRCPVICEQVEWIDFDIFGAQEIKKNQLDDLLAALPEYDYVGVGRDDGHEAGEYAAVFYRDSLYTPVADGHFWLSETPDSAALGWDAVCVRIATWVKLREKATGREFLVFNTHFDHIGVVARRESAKLLLSRVHEFGDSIPTLIMGDFNFPVSDSSLAPLVNAPTLCEARAAAKVKPQGDSLPAITYRGFGHGEQGELIDHIFCQKFVPETYEIITSGYGVPYLSDHLPVLTVLKY